MSIKQKSGFTLTELLVTISIIGLLSTIAVTALINARAKAKITIAQSDLSVIRKAIDVMSLDTGEWPGHQPINVVAPAASNELCNSPLGSNCTNSLSGGVAGITQDDASPNEYPFWDGPYMDTIPLDPWGNEYFFDTDYDVGGVDKAVLGSYGPNGGTNNIYNDGDNIIIILVSE